MGQPRENPESASDRCFACSDAISAADLAVYLYGAWFHLPCYERENNFPKDGRPVPRAVRPQPATPRHLRRLVDWINDTTPPVSYLKDPVAVELGRRGGLKGGKARAARLSPAQRAAIARRAARARWAARKEER
ncbi:MAG TPA: hypothetical protein VFW70_20675 [Methylomirabilota bacterium]|nr:hypothetical protein [Methylomirabilota bacterium]